MYLHILGHHISRENNEPLTFYEKNEDMVLLFIGMSNFSILKNIYHNNYNSEWYYTKLLVNFVRSLHHRTLDIEKIKNLHKLLKINDSYKKIMKLIITEDPELSRVRYDIIMDDMRDRRGVHISRLVVQDKFNLMLFYHHMCHPNNKEETALLLANAKKLVKLLYSY